MNPFDQAWALLKMARYQIGPTNMFDIADVSRAHDSGEFQDMMNQFGTEEYRYPIMGSATHFGDEHVKTMMTPTEYMKMAYDTPRERLMFDDRPDDVIESQGYTPNDNYLTAMGEQMKLGRPYGMPNLDVTQTEDGHWIVRGQEGRHRMQNLIDMGHGDVEVPVTLSARYPGKRRFYGGSQQLREALHGRDLIQMDSFGETHPDELHRIPIRVMEDQDFGEGTRRIV